MTEIVPKLLWIGSVLETFDHDFGIASAGKVVPPYCSKFNPIEHRLFSHVTRACRGVIFHTLEIVKHAIKRTWISTGLKVTVGTLNKFYELERQASDRFMEAYPIVFDGGNAGSSTFFALALCLLRRYRRS